MTFDEFKKGLHKEDHGLDIWDYNDRGYVILVSEYPVREAVRVLDTLTDEQYDAISELLYAVMSRWY